MSHRPSTDDLRFRVEFESGHFLPAAFDHRAHVRLAYVHLCESGPDAAHGNIRESLHTFLTRHGIDPAKYHETLTQAWVQAVRHFMDRNPGTESADEFMAGSPRLFETDIMLTHYSREVLFSDAARKTFVAPDREPIPAATDSLSLRPRT